MRTTVFVATALVGVWLGFAADAVTSTHPAAKKKATGKAATKSHSTGHATARKAVAKKGKKVIPEVMIPLVGFQRELDELLRPLPLRHQLAALVKHHIRLLLFGGKPRVWDLAKPPMTRLQPSAESGRLGVRELARIGRQWFHKVCRIVKSRAENGKWPQSVIRDR